MKLKIKLVVKLKGIKDGMDIKLVHEICTWISDISDLPCFEKNRENQNRLGYLRSKREQEKKELK